MEDKTYTYIFNDILSNVLQLSGNPSQFAAYLSQQIRELIGARIIVIAIKTETGEPVILSTFPERREEWANQPPVLQLAGLSFDFENTQQLEQSKTSENISALLHQLEMEKAIAIPLIVAERVVGSILLLDIMDDFGIESVMRLLNRLSGVFALVIRNANLYQNMENLVAARTRELQKRNDELVEERQRAEKSEMKTRDILLTAMDGFWAVDTEGRFLDVNQVACKMLGYTRTEMLTMGITDIEAIETAAQTNAHIKIIKEKGEGRFESKHRCKNGAVIDVEVSVKLQPNQDVFVVFVRDITERKQAEEKLKALEQRSRVWLENSPSCTKIVDLDFNLQFMSSAGIKMLNIDDITPYYGKPYPFHFYPVSFKTKMTGNMNKAIQTGEVITQEAPVIDLKGNEVWFHSTIVPVKDDNGRIEYLIIVSMDVTERKQAEERLKQQNELFDSLIKNLPMGVFMVEAPSGKPLLANDTALKLLGRGILPDVTSQNLAEVYKAYKNDIEHPYPIDEMPIIRGMNGEYSQIDDMLVVRPDNTETELEIYGSPVVNENGEVWASLVSFHDITERKQLEAVHTFLSTSGYTNSNENFFESLAKYLAEILDSEYVCIDKLVGDRLIAQTIAIYNQGKFDPNVSYTLKQTPCGDVVGKTICCFPENVCQLFPHDEALQDLKAHSYIGTTLWSFDGKPIGLIAIIGQKPLKNAAFAENVLKLVAIRAAGELERMQAEEKLIESEERFNLAMKAANDGLFDWNLETNEIYYAPAWKKMLGYEDHELPNDFSVWENTTDPEDVKKSWEMQQKLITRQIDRFVLEFKMKHKDGHWVNILSRAEAIFNSDRKAIRIVGTHTDITERKQAEEKLLASQARLSETLQNLMKAKEKAEINEQYFRTIFENSPIGKSITSLDGTLKANKAFSDMLGYTFDEFLAKKFTDITHPEDRQKSTDVIETLLKGKKTAIQFEKRYMHKNGSTVFANVVTTLQRNRNGEPLFFITSIIDITEQKRHEKIREIQYNIATAVVSSDKVDQLLGFVRAELSQLFDTTNFFAALYNAESNTLRKLHWIDEADDFEEWDATKSFSGYVVKTCKTLLMNKQEISRLGREQNIPTIGTPAECWLGVPLIVEKKAIGVLVIQSYTDPNAYDASSAMLFEQIAYDLSVFIEKAAIIQDLNLAKQKAEESEAKFRTLSDNSPAIIYRILIQPESRYDYISPIVTRITGYSPEEFYADFNLSYRMIHPDDLEINAGVNRKIHGEPFVLRLIRKDGKIIWVEQRQVMQYDKAGNPLAIEGISTDITAQKEAEAQLAFQANLLSQVSEAVIATDIDGKITYWNNSAEKLYGWKMEEVMGKSILEITPDLNSKEQAAEIFGMLTEGKNWTGEFMVRNKAGRAFPVIVNDSPLLDSNYNLTGVIGVSSDISERRQTEKALAAERKTMANIIEGTNSGTWDWNIQTGAATFNNRWAEIIGYTLKEFGPTDNNAWVKHVHPDDLPEVVDALQKHIRNEIAYYDVDFRQKHKNGSWVWVNARGKVVEWDEDGKPLIMSGTHLDITERKKAEQELTIARQKAEESEAQVARMNAELEQRIAERTRELTMANKELEAFSYSIAHNLRAPLRGINGYAQMLMDDYGTQLDDEGKRFCRTMQASSVKMGFLIDDLLAFSRVTRVELQRITLNMNEMVASVFTETTAPGMLNHIEFNMGNLCPAQADPALLKEVWVNLISNAVKYSSKTEKAIISVTCSGTKNESVYCIKDNGVGFNMEYSSKLFGVFQRLHSAKDFDGTGVGLAIVQRIIERHGGRVWAESEPGKGAAFYFSLPK